MMTPVGRLVLLRSIEKRELVNAMVGTLDEPHLIAAATRLATSGWKTLGMMNEAFSSSSVTSQTPTSFVP